jgi:hypothetical protein
MSWRSWWQARQTAKIQSYLQAHQDLAVAVLRQHPELSVAAAHAAMADLMAAQRGERKSAPWPILSQLGLGAKYPLTTTLPKVSPFNLRRFSEYPPARRAINAICNPIVDLAWEITLDRQPSDPKREMTLDEEAGVEVATRCLRQPNPDDSWRTLLEAVLEDLVIGGYGSLELVETGRPLKPLDLYGVDGQSIRLNASWNGDPAVPRYSQALAYVGMTVGTHDAIQLYDDELVYMRLNPRTHTPFGLGYLETAFSIINAWLGAFEYAERRASNATPNFAIFLGEDVDLPTVRQWQQYWQEQIEGYGKTPILGGGKSPAVLSMVGTGEDQLYLRWQEMLIRIIALAFGLSPMTLGLERDVNRATAQTQDVADWDAIKPVAQTVEDYLTHRVLWKKLGYGTLRFKFLVKDADELRQAQILQAQYDMDAVTIDEVRQSYEREPLPNGKGGLTKSEYTAMAAGGGLGPGLPTIGGPPILDEDGRWQEQAPALPVALDEAEDAGDELATLRRRARAAVERARGWAGRAVAT